MDEILAMTTTNELIYMGAGLLLAAAAIMVPLAFFIGWLSLKPAVGHGSLIARTSGGRPSKRQWRKARFTRRSDESESEQESKYKTIKAGAKIKVPSALTEDLASAGVNPINGSFVTLDGRLCAYDDGLRIFYRHSDILKLASNARVGRAFWLAVITLPIAVILPFLIGDTASALNISFIPRTGFIPHPEIVMGAIFVFYVILSIILWSSLVRLRSNAIIRRVEECLAWLDAIHNRPVPPVEKNPLRFTWLAALGVLASLAAGVIAWLQFIAPALGVLPGLVPLW